jgi:histidinol-phosphate phosphatase family protein
VTPLAPVDVVIPTVGRPSLGVLLGSLAASTGPLPGRVLLVDDRRDPEGPLLPEGGPPARLRDRVAVLRGRAAGPAAARNVGWRASSTDWVVFLDDDVVPDGDWPAQLSEDLAGLGAKVAGSQGRVRVPLPEDRRPTDWERNVKGLETSRWITADIAYRRRVLEEVGGFDERFTRAYREDADLGLRVTGSGYRIAEGRRSVIHPVRPAGRLVSVRMQAGNADDALMRALHGPDWRERAGAPSGRRPIHIATTAAGVLGLLATLAGHRKPGALGLAGWLAGTAELAWARIEPGPRTREEVATMLLTSALLPAAATAYWISGLLRRHKLLADTARGPQPGKGTPETPIGDAAGNGHGRPGAILLDRDGTLVVDVPYNGDPGRVAPMPGAREALDRLRAEGVPLGVVSNQSDIARGLLTREQVLAVNERVEDLLGPLGPWVFCPHGPDEGCPCRKPAPGLVREAAKRLGVDVARCVVIGDIGADVEAARAAGARGILVPTERTSREEIEAAPEVASDLGAAVNLLLGAAR